jgi:transcriptional regulator with XRE-family HTH domain
LRAGKVSDNPVDASIGARIRLRRRVLKVSQERLAYDLGLTPQQVQKYERAKNGVSASRLYQIARSLGSPIAYFFEDLPTPEPDEASADAPATEAIHAFLMTNEGVELARLFPLIRASKTRRHLLDLVRDLTRAAAADEANHAAAASPGVVLGGQIGPGRPAAAGE